MVNNFMIYEICVNLNCILNEFVVFNAFHLIICICLYICIPDKLVLGQDHGLVTLRTRVQFPVNLIKTL